MSNPFPDTRKASSSCGCNDTSPCGKCQNGQPCNCPPDYSVLPQPSPCICCPDGLTYDATRKLCIGTSNSVSAQPIPCVNCETALPTDCITYTGQIPLVCGNNVYGINVGDTLTTILNKMCITNQNVLQAMLSAIGLDPDTYSGLCQLVAGCVLPPGTTTPIPGPIVITFP